MSFTKNKIKAAFQQYRKENLLGTDEGYDYLLSDQLHSLLEDKKIEQALSKFCIALYPVLLKQQNALKEHLLNMLLEHIFNQLLADAKKLPFDIDIYFSLPSNDPVPIGERSQAIINVVNWQVKLFSHLATQFKITPIQQTLRFDEPPKQVSLLNDTIETVTGISNGVMTAGDKITSGSIVFTKVASNMQHLSQGLFTYGSLAMNAIDFILIPAGYIYSYARKERVPFNVTHNTKWALAAIALALAIISIAVPASALVISFVTASISLLTACYALGKLFYDDSHINKQRAIISNKINRTTSKMMLDQKNARRLRKQIRRLANSTHPDQTELNRLRLELSHVNDTYVSHSEKLKGLYRQRKRLKLTQHRQASPIEKVDTIGRVILASMVIAGSVLALNPATALIGVSMVATAAIISFTAFVAKKVLQVYRKKRERKVEQLLENTIDVDSTSTKKLLNELNMRHIDEGISHINRQALAIEQSLANLITAKNKPGMLEYFIELEESYMANAVPIGEVDHIFNCVDSAIKESAFELFKQVLLDVKNGKIYLHRKLKERLMNCTVLKNQLQEHGIEIQFNIRPNVVANDNSMDLFIEEISSPHITKIKLYN